jgi:hypothetical protein
MSTAPKPSDGEQFENLANDIGCECQRNDSQRKHMLGLDRGWLGCGQISCGQDRPY